MKFSKFLGALVLSAGLCSQSFGAGLLDRMVGGGCGPSCCEPSCCDAGKACHDPACGTAGNGCCDPGCGSAGGNGCCDPCGSSCGKKRCGLFGGLRADQSAPFEATRAKMAQFVEIVRADPAVQAAYPMASAGDSSC